MCVCASQQAAGACGLVVCDSWLGAYDVRDEGSAPNGWAPLLYRGVVRGRREPYHQTERHEGLVFSVYRDNVLCSGERESLVNTISDYGVTMGFGLRNCTVLGAKLRHAKPEPCLPVISTQVPTSTINSTYLNVAAVIAMMVASAERS